MDDVRASSRRENPEGGFALITVLWIAGLTAVLTASLMMATRTAIRVTGNISEAAKAEALADAGVSLAIMDLLVTRRVEGYQRRFSPDGRRIACSTDIGFISISVMDEAGKIDPNTAGIPIMRALFSGLGEPAERAAQLADKIADFRDADEEPRTDGAEAPDYARAGLSWSPKNAPFLSVEELHQVIDMQPEMIAKLRPYLTVFSGLPGVDPMAAGETLITLLRNGVLDGSSVLAGVLAYHGDVALPGIFMSASPRRIFSIQSEGRVPSGAVFVRNAIVDLGPSQARRHVILSWSRSYDHRQMPNPISTVVNASPC